MSRIKDYHRWLNEKARKNWMDMQTVHKTALTGGATFEQVAMLSDMANTAYEVYCFINLHNPCDHSFDKRFKKSRRARKRALL